MRLWPPVQEAWMDTSSTPEEARLLQERLASSVSLTSLSHPPTRIAGADAAYSKDGATVFAAVAVLEPGSWRILERAWASCPVPYPYIPSLLAFREGPSLIQALSRLSAPPDLVFFNGHGILHPRGLGLASHLGVLLGLAAIGCAQGPPARCCGKTSSFPEERGSCQWLSLQGRSPQGALLRTRRSCKPLFVSPGHLITLEEAVSWTLAASVRCRMPEPLRQAHILARRLRKDCER